MTQPLAFPSVAGRTPVGGWCQSRVLGRQVITVVGVVSPDGLLPNNGRLRAEARVEFHSSQEGAFLPVQAVPSTLAFEMSSPAVSEERQGYWSKTQLALEMLERALERGHLSANAAYTS